MIFDPTFHIADIVALAVPALMICGYIGDRLRKIEEAIDRTAISMENLRVRVDYLEHKTEKHNAL